MAETLLMIPGTLCDASLFMPQIEALKDIATCLVVDHYSSDNLKEVAKNILASVEGNFSVMGLSYGGIIAFEMMRQAPERINNLILLNTNHKLPSETTRANQQRFVKMAGNGEFKEITIDYLKDAMLHPKQAANTELRNLVLEMAINIGQQAFLKQINAQLNRPDSTADLANIHCPTLIMTGKQDLVCTPELHEEMARLIPNSQLFIIEECGHLSTLEQPEIVNQKIRQFLCEQIN